MDSLYTQIARLVAALKAEYAVLAKDGVLTWKEAVQLTVHAGREVAALVNGMVGLKTADRRTVLRDAAEQVFDQVVAPLLAAKLKSKWYLRLVSGFAIPTVRAFWMQTAEAAFDALANIAAVDTAPAGGRGGLVGVHGQVVMTAKEVRFGKA